MFFLKGGGSREEKGGGVKRIIRFNPFCTSGHAQPSFASIWGLTFLRCRLLHRAPKRRMPRKDPRRVCSHNRPSQVSERPTGPTAAAPLAQPAFREPQRSWEAEPGQVGFRAKGEGTEKAAFVEEPGWVGKGAKAEVAIPKPYRTLRGGKARIPRRHTESRT